MSKTYMFSSTYLSTLGFENEGKFLGQWPVSSRHPYHNMPLTFRRGYTHRILKSPRGLDLLGGQTQIPD